MPKLYMPTVGDLVTETLAFTQGDSNIFLTMVGYDYFGSEWYQLLVNMHCSIDGNEFMFGLITIDRIVGPQGDAFDSTQANKIVPKQHRSGVLRVLLEQTEKLINSCDLDNFFMVTYLPDLPEKALTKYAFLAEVFRRCGYDVCHTIPTPGKHMWQMNRMSAATLDQAP